MNTKIVLNKEVLKKGILSVGVSLVFFLSTGIHLQFATPPKKVITEKKAEIIVVPDVAYQLTNELSELDEFKNVDAAISRFIKEHKIAGASVAISKDEQLIYAKGFGYADKEKDELVEPTHLFRIASISKLITAVAIMKLVEENKLDLEDKVFGEKGILNEYTNIKDKRAHDITVKHLLQHKGGWGKWKDPIFRTLEIAEELLLNPPADTKTVITYVLSKNLNFTPGRRSSYSNFGYCLLGQVIEKVSGMPYENYVNSSILEPNGIAGMRLGKNLESDKADHEVRYYDYEGACKRASCYNSAELVSRPYGGTDVEALGPAGGWIASPAHLLQLLAMIDGNAKIKDILTKETIDLMTNECRPNCTLGWARSTKGTWKRTGTLAGTNALLIRRSDGISYAIVLNTGTVIENKFNNRLAGMMNKAIKTIRRWPQHDLFVQCKPAGYGNSIVQK